MSDARFVVFFAIAVFGLAAGGVVRWRAALPTVTHQRGALRAAPASVNDSLDGSLAEAEEMTVTNDPFRLANVPAAIRFDPNNDTNAGPSIAVSLPARPVMTLKAIVGGPPWQAVIDGIPGQPPGAVVRAGSAFDKLVARAVTRDSVVIQGFDTTWVLSFRAKP
jgi:hypothetical protein